MSLMKKKQSKKSKEKERTWVPLIIVISALILFSIPLLTPTDKFIQESDLAGQAFDKLKEEFIYGTNFENTLQKTLDYIDETDLIAEEEKVLYKDFLLSDTFLDFRETDVLPFPEGILPGIAAEVSCESCTGVVGVGGCNEECSCACVAAGSEQSMFLLLS